MNIVQQRVTCSKSGAPILPGRYLQVVFMCSCGSVGWRCRMFHGYFVQLCMVSPWVHAAYCNRRLTPPALAFQNLKDKPQKRIGGLLSREAKKSVQVSGGANTATHRVGLSLLNSLDKAAARACPAFVEVVR